MKQFPVSQYIILTILFCVIPFIFYPVAVDSVTPLRLVVLSGGIILAYLAMMLKSKQNIPLSEMRNGILLSLFAMVIFSLLSGIMAYNRAEWFYWVCRDIMNLGLFLLLYTGFRQQQSPLIPARRFATIVTLFLCAIGLIQFFFQTFFIIPGIEDIHALFTNRNLLASALFLLLPLNLSTFFREKGFWHFLGLKALSISFFMMTALRTRSVWVAMGLAIIFSVTAGLFNRKKPLMRELFPRKRIIRLVIIAVLFLAAGFITFELYQQYLGDDFAGKKIIGGSSVQVRLRAWRRSLDMIADRPLTGFGGGNWRLFQHTYRPEPIMQEKGFVYYIRPHNDYLWIASEYGIPGALAFLSIFVFFWLYVFRIMLSDKDGEPSSQALLIGLGVAGFMSVSFFSFPRERVFHSSMFIFYLASISALYAGLPKPKTKKSPRSLPGFVIWIMILALLISFIVFFTRLNGNIHLKRAMMGVDRIEEIKQDMRDGKITRARAGGLVGKQQNEIINEVTAINLLLYNVTPDCMAALSYRAGQYFLKGDFRKAYDDYQQAYRAISTNISLINNYAAAAGRTGRLQQALGLYKRQLELSPGFADAAANLARTHISMNHPENAFRTMMEIEDGDDSAFFQKSLVDIGIKLYEDGKRNRAKKLFERVDPDIDYPAYQEYRDKILNRGDQSE